MDVDVDVDMEWGVEGDRERSRVNIHSTATWIKSQYRATSPATPIVICLIVMTSFLTKSNGNADL